MSRQSSVKIKDPDADLPYKFDWAPLTNGTGRKDWLAAGETISSFVLEADAGITVGSSATADAATSVVVQVSGGTAGQTYNLTCRITTTDSNIDDRTMQFHIRER